MIVDKLIPRLRQRFPDRSVTFDAPPAPVAIFSASHPEVGDVQLFDEGNEVTLVAGPFTHGHFSDFASTSPEEAERHIVDDVVEFLERLFADQIVMWGSHRGGGGWYDRNHDTSVKVAGPLYVWSGPLGVG